MKVTEAHGFLPLHPLEFRIMLALLEDDTRHGYAIVRHIEESEPSWHRVLPANLYRRIRDLRTKGLVADAGLPPGVEPGERRKYFTLTDLGRDVVRAEAARLRTLLGEAEALDLLVGEGGGR